MSRPILVLDFDGVLHSYTSGWQGASNIPDEPVPHAQTFVNDALEHFEVAIYSSRSHQKGGIRAMKEWLRKWHFPYTSLQFPTLKPPAMLTIDDRAICFNGQWPTIQTLKEFKPWHKTKG